MTPKKAKWWFAWYPVRAEDTKRIVWLCKVYREQWYRKLYFESPDEGILPISGRD